MCIREIGLSRRRPFRARLALVRPTEPAIVVRVPQSFALPIVIAGAGLCGLSTALHLRESGYEGPIVIVERDVRIGGKTLSERRDGHTFDVTGHWLHLRDARVQALARRLFPADELVAIERKTGIHTHGAMLPYPFQANLHGLPRELLAACLIDFVEARCRAAREPETTERTFEEYAVARFGRGMAETFFIPYNRKLWGTAFDALTPDQVRRFVPEPRIDQVVAGALGLRQEGLGYNARYFYPRQGGIDALPAALWAAIERLGGVELRTGVGVRSIDLEARRVELDSGETLAFAAMVSTLPLPDLVDRCPAAASPLAAFRSALCSVSWRYLDIAASSPAKVPEHWIYVPEPRFPFFRVGIYSNALPAMAPPGQSSLYVELTDRDQPPDLPQIFAGLTEIGALADPAAVKFALVRDIQTAYVVFDGAHAEATTTIRAHFAARGVWSTGRYGAWTYNSMEDTILQGMEAAAWVLH